jgi:D-alanyl-D-alanine carboxypeptidase
MIVGEVVESGNRGASPRDDSRALGAEARVLRRSLRIPAIASIVAFAALALVVGFGGAIGLGKAAVSGHPDLEAELRGLIAMPGGPPGVIVVVQRGAGLQVYSAGVSDLRTRAPIRALDHMRIASTAKAFSGAVALSLVQRGVLSLSDTIGKWLPQLPRAWSAVTLAEALQHTSGLPDFAESADYIALLTKHPHATPSPLFLVNFVAKRRLAFKPGTRYRYANIDNFIVALMAQAATGERYERLLASLLYRPLRLTATSLPRGVEIPAPVMHGYQLDPATGPQDVSELFSAALSWASGGMISTPLDLNRFIRGYIGAKLFSRAIQADQLRLVRGESGPPGPGINMAGLAVFRYSTRCGTVYGHTGNIPGYTQFMAATLDGARSVTVSANEQLNQHQSGEQLAAFERLREIEEDAVCAAVG